LLAEETSERRTRELPTICTFNDACAKGETAVVFTAATVSEPCGKVAVDGKWPAAYRAPMVGAQMKATVNTTTNSRIATRTARHQRRGRRTEVT
jgi:hypothetical protein